MSVDVVVIVLVSIKKVQKNTRDDEFRFGGTFIQEQTKVNVS